MRSMSERTSWEGEVIEAVANVLEITYSDATGVVDAQPFPMAQSWCKGLGAEATAQEVITESEK